MSIFSNYFSSFADENAVLHHKHQDKGLTLCQYVHSRTPETITSAPQLENHASRCHSYSAAYKNSENSRKSLKELPNNLTPSNESPIHSVAYPTFAIPSNHSKRENDNVHHANFTVSCRKLIAFAGTFWFTNKFSINNTIKNKILPSN